MPTDERGSDRPEGGGQGSRAVRNTPRSRAHTTKRVWPTPLQRSDLTAVPVASLKPGTARRERYDFAPRPQERRLAARGLRGYEATSHKAWRLGLWSRG